MGPGGTLILSSSTGGLSSSGGAMGGGVGGGGGGGVGGGVGGEEGKATMDSFSSALALLEPDVRTATFIDNKANGVESPVKSAAPE